MISSKPCSWPYPHPRQPPAIAQHSGEIQKKTFSEVEDRIGAARARGMKVWSAFREAAYRALRNEYRFSSTRRFKL